MTTGSSLTLREFLKKAQGLFAASGFESSKQEARALVEAVAGLPLAAQLSEPDRVLSGPDLARLEEALSFRLQRKPLGQIAGLVWFYGRPFQVTEDTLSPRPETEHLVTVASDQARRCGRRGSPVRILDTFTGTGAVGLSLGAGLFEDGLDFDLILADLSPLALQVAAANARFILPSDKATLCQADIWPDGQDPYDLILANPPYIPSGELHALMPEVSVHEPALALDGGPDGLDFYRRLAAEGRPYLRADGLLLLEAGAGQADAISAIFLEADWREEGRIRDYAGHERVLLFADRSHVK